jgi:hypothetical protein
MLVPLVAWSVSTAVTYIFTAPTCTTIMINFFSNITEIQNNFLSLWIPLKEGDRGRGERRLKASDIMDNSNIMILCSPVMYSPNNKFTIFFMKQK